MHFEPLYFGFSFLPLSDEVVHTAALWTVVSVVYAEVAKHFLLSVFQSDLRVADDQIERVVSHWPFALKNGKHFFVGHWHDYSLSVGDVVGVNGTFWVGAKEESRFCFDDKDNVGDFVNVFVESGGV